MINIFIDTNIFISLITNTEDNKLFEELKIMTKEGIVKLLVPEIVILELEKQDRVAQEKIRTEFKQLDNGIKGLSKSLWSEVRYISDKISSLISDEMEIKLNMWEENYEIVKKYLKSNDVEYIEFTPEIMCKGQKRIIAGKLVRANDSSSQDAYNIESLISYFEGIDSNINDKFVICSNDIKDFSVSKKAKDGCYELHANFKHKLPDSKCFQTLKNLMKYINYGYEYEMEINVSNTNKFDISNYDNIDEYDEIAMESEDFNHLKEEVVKKLNHTPGELREYRVVIINNIKEILDQCRKLKSWDDRSELKLYSWIENRSEEDIEISKLSDLILIKNNLYQYCNIHLNEFEISMEENINIDLC